LITIKFFIWSLIFHKFLIWFQTSSHINPINSHR
jgi:hypothetical protein